MAKKPRVDENREPGGYCALPWCVIDSQAYQILSYPAVALLIKTGVKIQADQLYATARFVNESTSMEGRQLKLGALHEMFQLQPRLSPNQIDNIAKFVNAATNLEARRAKLG